MGFVDVVVVIVVVVVGSVVVFVVVGSAVVTVDVVVVVDSEASKMKLRIYVNWINTSLHVLSRETVIVYLL